LRVGQRTPPACSLQVVIDGQTPVTGNCIAGATAYLTGPAGGADNTVNVIQREKSGDLVLVMLHLTVGPPPTARIYDIGNVTNYLGMIANAAGEVWTLADPGSDPFRVQVTSMEELGPEDDLKGGALMGYRIHGTATATMTPSARSGPTGTATLTASF
jgi:hypothetical protein